MKYMILALLLSGCAHRKVVFLDSLEQPVNSAHVCIVKVEGAMECLSLEAFMKLVRQRQAEQTSDL